MVELKSEVWPIEPESLARWWTLLLYILLPGGNPGTPGANGGTPPEDRRGRLPIIGDVLPLPSVGDVLYALSPSPSSPLPTDGKSEANDAELARSVPIESTLPIREIVRFFARGIRFRNLKARRE